MARFVYECPMRWGDMDALGHINNTAYLIYLEQARIAMFFDQETALPGHIIIAKQDIRYLRPVVYHATPLRIEMWVSRVGGASFELSYEMYDPTPEHGRALGPASASANRDAGEVLAATAGATCVMYDFERSAPRRLAPSEREVLAALGDR